MYFKICSFEKFLAPGEMFDNMLQLMHFSVYFEGILNTNNGYFHIKIIISAVHMLGARGLVSSEFFSQKNAKRMAPPCVQSYTHVERFKAPLPLAY